MSDITKIFTDARMNAVKVLEAEMKANPPRNAEEKIYRDTVIGLVDFGLVVMENVVTSLNRIADSLEKHDPL